MQKHRTVALSAFLSIGLFCSTEVVFAQHTDCTGAFSEPSGWSWESRFVIHPEIERLPSVRALREVGAVFAAWADTQDPDKITTLLFLSDESWRGSTADLRRAQTINSLCHVGMGDVDNINRIMREVEQFRSLRSLALGGSQLNRRSYIAIARLELLEDLWIEDARITESNVRYIASLWHLRRLVLETCRVDDEVLAEIKRRLPGVEIVWVDEGDVRPDPLLLYPPGIPPAE